MSTKNLVYISFSFNLIPLLQQKSSSFLFLQCLPSSIMKFSLFYIKLLSEQFRYNLTDKFEKWECGDSLGVV